MKIFPLVNRELTESEIAEIQQFRDFTSGVSFAYLGNHVTVMLFDESSREIEKMKVNAEKHITEALSQHPDMDTFVIEDYPMVTLPSGVCAIGERSDSVGFKTFLLLRQKHLETSETN